MKNNTAKKDQVQVTIITQLQFVKLQPLNLNDLEVVVGSYNGAFPFPAPDITVDGVVVPTVKLVLKPKS